MEATVCFWFYYWSEVQVVQTTIIMQSAYTSVIEWSLLKWNGCDRDSPMHDAIGFYCSHVTMFWNFVGTANFPAAEVTVWTRRSWQTVSPMAWEWGYGKWPDMEIYLLHWSPKCLYWYGSLWILHLSNHTCIGLCRLNHSHAYLFYIIYDGTLWQMPQSYITFAFTKNSHYTYSIDQDLFLLVIYTTVCWRVPASQGPVLTDLLIKYHILVIRCTPDIISNLAWQQFKGSIY